MQLYTYTVYILGIYAPIPYFPPPATTVASYKTIPNPPGDLPLPPGKAY